MEGRRLTRREFLTLTGAGAAAMALPVPVSAVGEKRKPNIIVILSDDHGYGSIGCQGFKEIPTPHIDSIAKNGVRCTSGYVSCPICSPSRAGLLTGRYQTRFGHEDNPGPPPVCSPKFGLPEGEKTMGDYMKAQGYVTGAIGKWHLGHRPECHPTRRGFDEFFGFLTGAHSYTDPKLNTPDAIQRGTQEVDEREYLTDAFGREAVSFIDRHKDKPFFLYLPFNAVHHPLETPPRYEDSFTEFKTPEQRKFMGMLAAMDDAIGAVLKKLRETGLEEDTIVFFIGDNGGFRLPGLNLNKPLRGFKGDTYEGGVRVPFLVQWKGKIPAGVVYEKPLIALDVLPTALAAAGAKVPAKADGVNLLPYLTGKKKDAPHDELFWRWCRKSGARVGDWKLVRTSDGVEQLFNLADDIGEAKDLAASDPDKLKELQDAYKAWDARNIAPLWEDGRPNKGGLA